LGGDTEKAASYADRAIIDMADNANKMGTSMESIQNAYQGFAKQNYTMLDNLKLGYGGTQEEMKRLIADAAKFTDIQEEMGITVDANSMSFGNIVNAISVMQEKMGIAGTTADEAATTISGSIGMMKASWENLTVAMSSDEADVREYVKNFVDSVSIVGENLMPRISVALEGVVQLIDQLAPVIIGKFPELLSDTDSCCQEAFSGL
jgi:phage-related protein